MENKKREKSTPLINYFVYFTKGPFIVGTLIKHECNYSIRLVENELPTNTREYIIVV